MPHQTYLKKTYMALSNNSTIQSCKKSFLHLLHHENKRATVAASKCTLQDFTFGSGSPLLFCREKLKTACTNSKCADFPAIYEDVP